MPAPRVEEGWLCSARIARVCGRTLFVDFIEAIQKSSFRRFAISPNASAARQRPEPGVRAATGSGPATSAEMTAQTSRFPGVEWIGFVSPSRRPDRAGGFVPPGRAACRFQPTTDQPAIRRPGESAGGQMRSASAFAAAERKGGDYGREARARAWTWRSAGKRQIPII
jgi:hypothetical protein